MWQTYYSRKDRSAHALKKPECSVASYLYAYKAFLRYCLQNMLYLKTPSLFGCGSSKIDKQRNNYYSLCMIYLWFFCGMCMFQASLEPSQILIVFIWSFSPVTWKVFIIVSMMKAGNSQETCPESDPFNLLISLQQPSFPAKNNFCCCKKGNQLGTNKDYIFNKEAPSEINKTK